MLCTWKFLALNGLQYTGYGYGMGLFPETFLKCCTANALGGYSTRISPNRY